MTMNPFSAELAAERRRELLQRADAYRAAKGPARRHVTPLTPTGCA